MTRDEFGDNITTAGEFEAALAAAVEAAVAEDVDVRGAWEFRTNGSRDSWEGEIFELAKDGD
jgi:hypothetical protein